MNADDCNGRSYTQGNGGETSMEQDFYGPVQGPARSPNSQQSSPRRSLSANSIKVELCSEDESPGAQQPESREAVKEDSRKDGGGDPMEEGNTQFTGAPRDRVTIYSEMASPNAASPGPIRLPNGKLQCEVCGIECVGPNVLMVHKRSHTGERPFHCNQCGASFTQKGNLLRHIKLHSGEKPFKCPSCNYACRRRDALAGHLRTHAASSPMMGKPFKCNYCSRSYKQQSTLEEHLECCQNYLKSLDHQATVNRQSKTQGEESANMEIIRKRVLQPSSERIQFVERLANSITKRKRSTPQKFLGEKHMHLNPPEAPYELSSGSEKDGDLMSSQPTGDSAGLPSSRLQGTKGKERQCRCWTGTADQCAPSPATTAPSFSWTMSCSPSTWAVTASANPSSATSAATSVRTATSSRLTSAAESTRWAEGRWPTVGGGGGGGCLIRGLRFWTQITSPPWTTSGHHPFSLTFITVVR
uniref:IKAROS family zinc finger 4 n=1 Tax=Cynoglossus semilaevis TaxID=244447 RepID=A0A3P8V706_CYNSE